MPWTLAEHAIAQTEPLKKGVYLGITRASVVADLLNFDNVGSLTKAGVRYDEVIEPDFIPISGSIAEKTAHGKNLSYGVYQLAVHLDIPRPLESDSGVLERPSTRLARLTTTGSAYKFNDVFVNGDQGSDPNSFEGIEKIIGNLGSDQEFGTTEIDISGAPTDADMHSFIDRLDEAIDGINGHQPDFALCSRKFGIRARSVMRRLGLLGDNHNWVGTGFPFGDVRQTLRTAATRPMFVYADVPFYWAGPKADQTSQVIADDNAEAGSAGATRVYMVKKGGDDLEGLQYGPPGIRKIADTLHDKEVTRHRFTWSVGLAAWSKDCLSVVRGIKVE